MDRALENSLGTGDEGYAAWLQYVEIQKVKRERKALMLEEKDSKGEEKKGDRNKDTEWVLVKKGDCKITFHKQIIFPFLHGLRISVYGTVSNVCEISIVQLCIELLPPLLPLRVHAPHHVAFDSS